MEERRPKRAGVASFATASMAAGTLRLWVREVGGRGGAEGAEDERIEARESRG